MSNSLGSALAVNGSNTSYIFNVFTFDLRTIETFVSS